MVPKLDNFTTGGNTTFSVVFTDLTYLLFCCDHLLFHDIRNDFTASNNIGSVPQVESLRPLQAEVKHVVQNIHTLYSNLSTEAAEV